MKRLKFMAALIFSLIMLSGALQHGANASPTVKAPTEYAVQANDVVFTIGDIETGVQMAPTFLVNDFDNLYAEIGTKPESIIDTGPVRTIHYRCCIEQKTQRKIYAGDRSPPNLKS